MKPYSAYLLAGMLCLSSALPAFAADTTAPDSRTSLGMTPEERAEFLSEMRKMLGSIQGILQGISSEDRNMIAEFATQSGNRMARATPDTLRNR